MRAAPAIKLANTAPQFNAIFRFGLLSSTKWLAAIKAITEAPPAVTPIPKFVARKAHVVVDMLDRCLDP